jgi:hypothetical protein
MLALSNDNLNNITITGKNITQTNPDGFTTTATLDGKTRTLSRTDSTYKLKSNLDAAAAQQQADKIDYDLATALKPLDKELTTLKAMKAHLDEAKTQGTPLETLKTDLQAHDSDLYTRL